MGTSLTALAAFLTILVAAWIVVQTYNGKQIIPAAEVAPARNSVAQRLLALAKQRSDYRIMVGIPLAAPTEWAKVVKVDDDTIDIETLGTRNLSEVGTFFVAYPNGQLIDVETCGLHLPKGTTGLWGASSNETNDVLHDGDLAVGKKRVRIEYGECAARPNDPEHYSTTLTNLTDQRIKVLRFAGYHRYEDDWKLATVTRKFYSAEEFREWYGLGKEEWIAPGKSVADPNNYGGRPVLWAYYCKTESGETFIAGDVLE